jgi:hypothetical protein
MSNPLLDDEKPNEPYSGKNWLWEGFGTMVLVNKDDATDRTMIIEVRPPDVVDERVMREFSKRSREEGWWALPAETCIGEVGQANLLQAQVRRCGDTWLMIRYMMIVYRIMCIISQSRI